MTVYVEISNIITNDTLGMVMAIGCPIENVPQKKRNEILTTLTKNKYYEQLPGTFVAEMIVQRKTPVKLVLSTVGVIAEQQTTWVQNVIAPHMDIEVVEFSDIESTPETLLIAENRPMLVKHGAKGGMILPYTTNSQLEYIMQTIHNHFYNPFANIIKHEGKKGPYELTTTSPN